MKRFFTSMVMIALAALVLLAFGTSMTFAQSCPVRCAAPATAYQPRYVQPRYIVPAAQYRAPAPVASYQAPAVYASASYQGDPYGFLSWLNAYRARHGRAPVSWDANLANWAAQNSAAQSRRGLGHWVMGPARRQNSAMGSFAQIGPMWAASPPHNAALLDPTVTVAGLAGSGNWWTLDLR